MLLDHPTLSNMSGELKVLDSWCHRVSCYVRGEVTCSFNILGCYLYQSTLLILQAQCLGIKTKVTMLICPKCIRPYFLHAIAHKNLFFMYYVWRMNQKHIVNYAACVTPYPFAVEGKMWMRLGITKWWPCHEGNGTLLQKTGFCSCFLPQAVML